MIEKLKVYFFGAGEVAVPILLRLATSDFIDLKGVVTQVDKPAGRKKVMTATPVAKIASIMNIEVEKLPSVNEPEFVEKLKGLDLDFIVVVSFGQFLKADILNVPRYKCINIHTSILPKYRGASPIVSALLNRDKYTGISFMEMDLTMDTGAVYQCIEIPILPTYTASNLENQLGQTAANHIDEILVDIKNGRLLPTLQDNSMATYCSKIKKQSGLIDWSIKSCFDVDAMVRAYTPWPHASAIFPLENGKTLQVAINSCKIHRELSIEKDNPHIISADKNGIFIACVDGGVIEIETLTIPGKKEMTSKEFVNGYHLALNKGL